MDRNSQEIASKVQVQMLPYFVIGLLAGSLGTVGFYWIANKIRRCSRSRKSYKSNMSSVSVQTQVARPPMSPERSYLESRL